MYYDIMNQSRTSIYSLSQALDYQKHHTKEINKSRVKKFILQQIFMH